MRKDDDLRGIEDSIDNLAMSDWGEEGENEVTVAEAKVSDSLPSPVKSLVAILETLPPGGRVIGLALLLFMVALAAWKGGVFK